MHWMQLMEHTPFTEEMGCKSQLAIHSEGPNSQAQVTSLRMPRPSVHLRQQTCLGKRLSLGHTCTVVQSQKQILMNLTVDVPT